MIVLVMCPALPSIELCGKVSPAKGPFSMVNGRAGIGDGIASSRSFVMIDRYTPPSTAMTEPLRHSWAIERTRKALVLHSCGPPPAPCDRVSQCGLIRVSHRMAIVDSSEREVASARLRRQCHSRPAINMRTKAAQNLCNKTTKMITDQDDDL